MESFFLMGAKPLVSDAPVIRLHQLLNWDEIAHKLKGLYRREISQAGGPQPYAPLSMFKLMLLGQWHGLSDTQLEHALKVRIDFMVFTGFEPADGAFPDATTICRFRNRLVNAKLDQVMLRLINAQLERHGLKVGAGHGAIVDATIITSAARPRNVVEVDDSNDENGDGTPQVTQSADTEARWVKKGSEAFYGYRGFAAVDSEDGYVEHVQVHPANQAEVSKLTEVVDKLPHKPVAVLADKGFASAANREHLRQQSIGDLIQFKASRGHPLHPLQTQMNRAIGAVRYKVEQAFGTMKRRFHLDRGRYFGAAKTQAQMCWAALGMNLLKAWNKLDSRPMRWSAGMSAS